MFCVKCGHPLKTNYRFCPKCGTKQPDLVECHSSTGDIRKPREVQEVKGRGQVAGDFQNPSAGGTFVKTSPDLSVAIRYEMSGLTETMKLSLPCILGRTYEWPFLLTDEKASQQHAKIYLEDNAVMIEDLQSLNGTYVNGKKIKGPIEVLSGDEVTIGMTNLFFIVSAEN